VLFTVFFYATKLQSDKAMTYPTLKNYFVLIFSIMTAVYALAIAHLFRGAGKHA
jgi:hypothetical protein